MKLLREQTEKQRSVYLLDDRIRKFWHISKLEWANTHFKLLNEKIPGYAINIDNDDFNVWIDYVIIPGVPASTFPHTPEFVKTIYNFCLSNIEETAPYYHGDWSLSNIIIDDKNIRMCDWDNLGIYPKDQVIEKLHSDLTDAFGSIFTALIK